MISGQTDGAGRICSVYKNYENLNWWRNVEVRIIKLMEVKYVGTHEGVNYNRID